MLLDAPAHVGGQQRLRRLDLATEARPLWRRRVIEIFVIQRQIADLEQSAVELRDGAPFDLQGQLAKDQSWWW